MGKRLAGLSPERGANIALQRGAQLPTPTGASNYEKWILALTGLGYDGMDIEAVAHISEMNRIAQYVWGKDFLVWC